MKKQKDFITDEEGKITNCSANIAKMSLFEIIKFGHIGFEYDWQKYFEALVAVIIIPLSVIFYPISILLKAYSERKRARKKVKIYEEQMEQKEKINKNKD